jgi:hypothetical protein
MHIHAGDGGSSPHPRTIFKNFQIMSDTKLGVTIGDSSAGTKDAVHVAVVGVVAGFNISPGIRVKLDVHQTYGPYTVKPASEGAIGVIDPFLKAPVPEGQACFMLLYPGTTSGLRHEWSHPAFPEVKPSPWDKEMERVEDDQGWRSECSSC